MCSENSAVVGDLGRDRQPVRWKSHDVLRLQNVTKTDASDDAHLGFDLDLRDAIVTRIGSCDSGCSPSGRIYSAYESDLNAAGNLFSSYALSTPFSCPPGQPTLHNRALQHKPTDSADGALLLSS